MHSSRRLIAAVCLCLLGAGCSGSISIGGLDIDGLEEQIAAAGDEQVAEGAPWSVDCPEAPDSLAQGDTFTCIATAEDGTEIDVVVTATDDDNNVDFSYQF